MLRTVTALVVTLALSLALAACGGSGGEPTVDESAATATPTQAAAATPRAQPTATEAAAGDEATATPAPAGTATATAQPEATATAEATATEVATAEATAPPVDVVAQIRERTEAMWEVYNSYDADGLEAFYEPSFWEAEEEEVRANMRPFRTFGVTIRAEETSPPTEIAPGQWEIRQTGHFPLGSIKLAFVWEEFDGVWLLVHTEAE